MKLYGPLDNYMLTLRKRAGLSQDELSILLGLGGGDAVSLYERSERMPDLRTVLALEIIFEQPIRRIFPEIAADVRRYVGLRAQSLLSDGLEKTTAENADKLSLLDHLTHLAWKNSR